MRSGMTADLTFIMAEHDHVLLVPVLAVTHQGTLDTVLEAADEPGGSPMVDSVTLGLGDGKQVEIVSGLKENDTVLVEKANLTIPTTTSLLPTPPKNSGPPLGGGASPP